MHKLVGVLAAVLIGMACWLWCGGTAAAETGGYPYADKPCVRAPYARQATGANWCPNYDWGDRQDDTSAANVISPYGYYYRNCTDYAAWRLAGLGVVPEQYKGLGDAREWAMPPAGKGLAVDTVPVAGSIAVRTSGTYGHVAFVEAVFPDGTIRVSQYNRHADGKYSVSAGTPVALGFSRFVHFAIPRVLESPAAAVQAPAEPVPPPAVSLEPVPVIVHQPPEPSAQVSGQVSAAMSAAAEPAPLTAATPVTRPVPLLPPEPLPPAEPERSAPAAAAVQPRSVSITPAASLSALPADSPASTAPPVAAPPPSSASVSPPPPATLRSAGFAAIVVPYAWQRTPAVVPTAATSRPPIELWLRCLIPAVILLFSVKILTVVRRKYGDTKTDLVRGHVPHESKPTISGQ